ncbi:PD-(D/E)XK motif protein [Blastococcus sp. TF02-8]|uniref:PD-(D/E)XK motif protein n=1 Tax=Blastococcus sp. TF02-8 TaxID=2250574 RepID=UPI000DEBC306|nr:PD-(D/E)XK motif protein [Blastococcus sp. TF02-8]RBY97954.1 PD-(D/E)XK motif protein [Blastococcus sp. TF02-8]
MRDDNREHLTAETLETYFGANVVVNLRLADEPECHLRIDPTVQRLQLWTPAAGPEPDVTAMDRVSVTTEQVDRGTWFVLEVDAEGSHYEAYSLIAAVVDDLTASRLLHVAMARSVESFKELLANRQRLSEEKTIGLIGELLLLESLIDQLGETSAVLAWVGPDSEEHDFVLADVDAEVKTTLSERRIHRIGTETQLQPSLGRPLWLVSIQLTRAGDAVDGFGLSDVVGRVRTRVQAQTDAFAGHLRSVGWRDSDADLYRERYLLRSRPAAYFVDDAFPALTRRRIDGVVPQPELVTTVSYRVDVSSLVPGSPPGALAQFVGGSSE